MIWVAIEIPPPGGAFDQRKDGATGRASQAERESDTERRPGPRGYRSFAMARLTLTEGKGGARNMQVIAIVQSPEICTA